MKSKRKRIYTPAAVKWDRNPMYELAKLKAKELNISISQMFKLLEMEEELATLNVRP